MQSIILTSQPLDVHSLHQALRRLNVDVICARISSLTGWQPDTDAIIFAENVDPRYFDLLSDFVDELPAGTPLIFLSPLSVGFKLRFQSILDHCIVFDPNLNLGDTAMLISEIIIEAFDPYHEEISCGPIILNRRIRHLEVMGQNIKLTKKEFCLMELLTRNFGKIITRERILDYVWDRRKYVSPNTIDVYVSRLRKKLPNQNEGPIIKTIPCMGYSLHLNSNS